MARTPNAGLLTDIDGAPMARADWNKLADGVDRQTCALFDGVVGGGAILAAKTVAPVVVVVGGFVGSTASNQAITGLVNSIENTVWCVRVDSTDPAVDTTFNAGVLAFVAASVAPPNAVLLGTITLDGGGTATAVDNAVAGRTTLVPNAAQTWEWSVEVSGVSIGDDHWEDVDHSGEVIFRAALLLEVVSVTSGYTVTRLENCQPGQFGFLCSNVSSYSGTCTAVFRRTGVPA